MLRKTIHLPIPMWADIKKGAEEHGVSVAEYIRMGLSYFLRDEKPKGKRAR